MDNIKNLPASNDKAEKVLFSVFEIYTFSDGTRTIKTQSEHIFEDEDLADKLCDSLNKSHRTKNKHYQVKSFIINI